MQRTVYNVVYWHSKYGAYGEPLHEQWPVQITDSPVDYCLCLLRDSRWRKKGREKKDLGDVGNSIELEEIEKVKRSGKQDW